MSIDNVDAQRSFRKSEARILSTMLVTAIVITCIDCSVQQIPQEPYREGENPTHTFLNTPFRLRIGQMTLIESEDLSIEFLDVIEDSRLPSDVVGKWEGRAKALVSITKDGRHLPDLILTSGKGNEDLALEEFDDYSIKLIKLEPYPKTTQRIHISDYVATLVVF